MTGSTTRYLRALIGGRHPARAAARVLADVLRPTSSVGERRRAAARAVAVAAALLPCALSRHGVHRGGDLSAMWDVARKFGRPEDLDAPEIGVRAQLDRTRLDPRLGGLLGDAADAISAWLASDSGIPPSELGRCVAAVAPLVLGTVARVAESLSGPNGAGAGLTIFLADFPPEALEHLDALDANSNPTGRIYRTVFRHASGRAGLGWFAFRFRS